MEISDLGMLERLLIILRCRRDLRKQRFAEFKYNNAEGVAQRIFFSPFVTTELACFVTKRTKQLCKKIVLLNVSKSKSLLGIRLFKVPNAICKVDELIAKTECQICCTIDSYEDRIRTLQDKSVRYTDHGATHHAQSCVDDISAIHMAEKNEIRKLQKKLLAFANEKVKIISVINAKVNALKAHRIMRIQYYYGYASSHSEELPVMMYTQEDFEAVSGEKIGAEHTGLLEAAQQKVAEITNATVGGSSEEKNASV